jgi:hypothetical protein
MLYAQVKSGRDGELLDRLTTDPVLKVLRAVDERLATEDDWCQDVERIDNSVCLWGAYDDVSRYAEYGRFARALGFNEIEDVAEWNDAHGRTFPEVKALFARAISKRMAELERQDV